MSDKEQGIFVQMMLAHSVGSAGAVDHVMQELQRWGAWLCFVDENFHRVIEKLFQLPKFEGSIARAVLEKEMVPLAQELAFNKFGCRIVIAALTYSQSEDVQRIRSSFMEEGFIKKGWKSQYAIHPLEVALRTGTAEEWRAHRRALTLDFINDIYGSYGISALIQNVKKGVEQEHHELVKEVLNLEALLPEYERLAAMPKGAERNEEIRTCLPAFYAIDAAFYFSKQHTSNSLEAEPAREMPQKSARAHTVPEPAGDMSLVWADEEYEGETTLACGVWAGQGKQETKKTVRKQPKRGQW
jgi:hypothetical protein